MALRDVSKAVTGAEIAYDEAALAEILSPQHFVNVRRTYGGPAPSETLRAVGVSGELLGADNSWLRETRDKLAGAEARLKEVSAAL